jgi:hypothetical protein
LSWGIGHTLGYHAGAEEGKLLQIGPATCALLILKLQLTLFGNRPVCAKNTGKTSPKVNGI